jgi:predicted ester cyclase
MDDIVAEGDGVVARWSGTGTHLGDGLGLAATGRQVQFRGVTIVRIEQGKLMEGWNTFNQLEMFQQLGVVNLPLP